jgi:hypothetical protein
MKVIYYDNSNDVLTDEDHILFSSIVGRDIAELEAEIKKQDTRTIQEIYSNQKYIHNIKLNELGLHVYRVILANKTYQSRIDLSDQRVRDFYDQGYVIIENFLPDLEFTKIKNLFEQHILPKYPNGVKKSVDASGFFDRNQDYYNFIKQCAGVRQFSHDAPNGIPRTEFWNHIHEPNDTQYKLHTDTFQPTCKFWLYLEDISEEQGPLTLVPKSHICNERRLKWDFENSQMPAGSEMWSRRIEKGGKPGSFRVFENSSIEEEEEEVLRLGYEGTKMMLGKKNSLVAVNTFCFHKRGVSTQGTHRRTLTTQYRPVAFGVY